jgi:hypothetical protein
MKMTFTFIGRATLIAASALVVPSLVGSSTEQAIGKGTACDDITMVDYKNSRIDVGEHGGTRILVFHNGEALQYGDDEGLPKAIDWRATIEEDINVDAAVNVPVRFLLIHDSHEGGSGWRYYLLGYMCFDGNMRRVFERDAMSLHIDTIGSQGLVISLNLNTHKAVREHFLYVWDSDHSRYTQKSKWLGHKRPPS